MGKRRSGGDLLLEFMAKNKLTPVEAAKMLRVSPVSIHYWTHGKIPRAGNRQRIAAWSMGAVPAEAWADAKELATARDFEPIRKAAVG
jgi:hypothetical protein